MEQSPYQQVGSFVGAKGVRKAAGRVVLLLRRMSTKHQSLFPNSQFCDALSHSHTQKQGEIFNLHPSRDFFSSVFAFSLVSYGQQRGVACKGVEKCGPGGKIGSGPF